MGNRPFAQGTLNQTLAFLYSSVERIFNFNLDKQKQATELEFLRKCCRLNNLDVQSVDKIFLKIERKRVLGSLTTLQGGKDQKKKFIGLPFNRCNQFLARKMT